MKYLVSKYSDTMNSIINSDLLSVRNDGEIVKYIDLLCKEIEKLLGKEAEYLGYETSDTIEQAREMNRYKKKRGRKNTFRGQVISTELTYSRTYKFKFKVTFKEETRFVNMTIYVPLISDDGINYLIKGNKYCIPYQIVDAVTYNTVKKKYDEVCLKTTIQDIIMQRFKISISDINGNKYSAYRFNIKLNKSINKIPFLLFYFATFGFYKTLKYFGLDNPIVNIKLYNELPPTDSPLYKYYTFFKFGSLFLMVRTEAFINNSFVRDLIANILIIKKRSITESTIGMVDFWTSTLGSHLSQNNPLSSGVNLKTTFHNCVDPHTIKLLHTFAKAKNIRTTYSAVRWMFFKYAINVSKGISLENKRLRIDEYVISPLKNALKNKVFQWSKIRGSFREIRRLEEIFKIRPTILLDAIIGNSQSLNIARYNDNVNDFSLLNDITVGTTSGPDTGSSGSWSVKGNELLSPSMVGRVDIISSSVTKPGISKLLPNCKIDTDTLSFVFDD